ncbi:MAG: hypothetical protein LBI29_00380 [Rickettsiales bacterium]|nr:hypothetical protein [Rickettsiales bacterium]
MGRAVENIKPQFVAKKYKVMNSEEEKLMGTYYRLFHRKSYKKGKYRQGEYKSHNCQDFAEEVLKEYVRLGGRADVWKSTIEEEHFTFGYDNGKYNWNQADGNDNNYFGAFGNNDGFFGMFGKGNGGFDSDPDKKDRGNGPNTNNGEAGNYGSGDAEKLRSTLQQYSLLGILLGGTIVSIDGVNMVIDENGLNIGVGPLNVGINENGINAGAHIGGARVDANVNFNGNIGMGFRWEF